MLRKHRDMTDPRTTVINLIEESQEPLPGLLDVLAGVLYECFPHYTGVYIYLLHGETLMLETYRGRPTQHTNIPIGAGICGRAARIRETVVVDDVSREPEYIACSLETRSEIVVPILRGDRVHGELDIDSDVPAAFTVRDRQFLEDVATRLAHRF